MDLTLIIILAALLVLGLAAYAGDLFLQLRAQDRAQSAGRAELEEELAGRNKKARESVRIIARALVQNDLSETEAAMRISFLSKQIRATEQEAGLFEVFNQLAEATAYIPILDDWALLERSEKRRLTNERETIEAKYRDFIQAGAIQLIEIDPK